MVFDWAKYLILAEELQVRGEDEAALRSALSRAYYAVFCKARNRLLQEGISIPRTGNAHKMVWEGYRKAGDIHRRDIGTKGDRLRRSRNKADYDDEFPSVAVEVRRNVTSAKRLLEYLENLNNGEP